jgi:hypothetical protein
MKKYFKHFSLVGALSLLVVCYFQQKENAKLRAQIKEQIVNVDTLNKVDNSSDSEDYYLLK